MLIAKSTPQESQIPPETLCQAKVILVEVTSLDQGTEGASGTESKNLNDSQDQSLSDGMKRGNRQWPLIHFD